MSIRLKKELDAARQAEALAAGADVSPASASPPGTGIYFGSAEKVIVLRGVLLALKEVRAFNFSVPQTLSLAVRVYESYLTDKARFAATFTPEGFDAASLEDFPTRVGVLWYLNMQLGQMVQSSALSPELVAVAKPLCEKLARAALYLFESDKTLGPVVEGIRKGRGYLDMADDLARYAVLFDENWERVEGHSDVTAEDIDTASEVSVEMLKVLTDNGGAEIESVKDLRSRSAEYLARGVHLIRRGALYIFDEDESELARYPSLYQKRRRRAKPAVETDPEPPEQNPESPTA